MLNITKMRLFDCEPEISLRFFLAAIFQSTRRARPRYIDTNIIGSARLYVTRRLPVQFKGRSGIRANNTGTNLVLA